VGSYEAEQKEAKGADDGFKSHSVLILLVRRVVNHSWLGSARTLPRRLDTGQTEVDRLDKDSR
jgi:hypothetical protein